MDFLFWFFESQFMSSESCGSGMKWTSSGGLDLCSKASRTSRRSHQQGMLCLVEDVGIFSKNMPDALTCNCTFFKSVESITFIIIIAAEKRILCFFKFVKTMKNSRQFVGAAMNRQIKLNQVRTSILCNDLIVHANAYKGSSNKGFAKEWSSHPAALVQKGTTTVWL